MPSKNKKVKIVFLGGKTETVSVTSAAELIERYSGYDLFIKNKPLSEKSRIKDNDEVYASVRTTKA